MPAEHILVLGGTSLARDLADALIGRGFQTTTSLAGVTRAPVLPQGCVRQGGFGGVDGLIRFLRQEEIAAIADATHPFAAQISAHASAAATATSVPYLRLEPPPWTAGSRDKWLSVTSVAAAAEALPCHARVLATIGRKEIGRLFARSDLTGIARMIEPPAGSLPESWKVLLSRPPFSVESETALFRVHDLTHVVAKNSGNQTGFAKFVAARELGLSVVLIDRPKKPDAPTAATVDDLLKLLYKALWA